MLLLFITIFLALETFSAIYILRVTRKRIIHKPTRQIALTADILAIALMAVALSAPIIFSARLPEAAYYNLLRALFISLAAGAALTTFVIIDLIASIPIIFKHKRIKPLTIAAIFLAIATFSSAFWAMANKYNIQIKHIEIPIPDLPDAFNNYTIAQISDLHVGTFQNDTTFVSQLVDRINSLNPDLIIFTGDIVNRHASELTPFIPPLTRLHAHDGQYAVLGNHDYADYFYTPTDTISRLRDRQLLRDLYKQTSLTLLEDSTTYIHRRNDSIAIIGVGNIGVGRFPVYGSVHRAYPNPADSTVKILLSHDPNHWVTDIADNPNYNIHLTLSGHTHAMQTMILGHTPASFAYKTPAGHYTDTQNTRHLYVNIGAGTIGMPMRLGATPEITFITLRTTK